MTYLTPGEPKKRLRAFFAIVAIIAVVFSVRLIDLQVVQAGEINKISFENRSVTRTIPALRGDILDSNGKLLAHTVYRYDINAAPSKVSPVLRSVSGQEVQVSVEQIASELATILEMDAAEVMQKIIGTSEYSNIKKKVNAEVYRRIRALEIPWLYYDPIPTRVYPNGAVAGNVVGFLGSDGTPLAGLERQLNSCLAGVDGEETFEKGVDGIKIPSSAVITKEARPGRDVVLTIDVDLQYFSQQVLANTVVKLQAEWASAIVVEAATGKVLVAAEAPTVDPNAPGKSDAEDRESRIFQATFEPGSTLKTVTAATVIAEGTSTPGSGFKVPYRLPFSFGRDVTDSHFHPTEKLTLAGILADSSNTGIILAGQKVSAATRYNYMRKFGLGEKTAINFAGESGGILHKPGTSSYDLMTDKVTMFGQGLAVTPIQTAYIYQAIANDGVRLPAEIVAGCKDSSGKFEAAAEKQPVTVMSSADAKTMQHMLEMVVTYGGIGKTAAIPGYRVGGKTGTAQIKNGYGYGYKYAISFIGMAPVEDPKYVVAVTIYKPTTISNSLGATPPFKQILQQVLRNYRVPPSTTTAVQTPKYWH
jgi:cell division protein FtsI (penicillin-binding protein 3)